MIHELGYRDKVIIPDKYNTGVMYESLLVPATTKFPSWDGYMTSSIISQNGGYVFENIFFSNTIAVKASQINHALYFKNCKFVGGTSYAVSNSGDWTSDMELHFDHCEFSGYTSAAVRPSDKTTFKNCKIHHMPSDGLKGGFSNGGFENCYIYDIGYDNPEAHADGVQTTGYNKDLYIRNCRFDVPSTKDNVGNAGIFFVQEADSVDAVIEDILINGGNYSFYLGIKEGKTATITGLTGSNIKIGASYAYGRANISDVQYQNWTSNGTITSQDKLFVSSVFMGANGKIKVHASNYTESSRTLILVSDEETQTYTVPAHPTLQQCAELTFDDLPYDLEYEVEGNYVTCYDGSIADSNEIRFAYANVSELFGDIADSIRAKTGGTDLIPRENIPYEISQISSGITPTGTINITQNGDTDVTNYATAHVAVPEPSGSQTFTNNGTYNVSSIAQAIINVSSTMPAYITVQEQTLSEDSVSITAPYDSTRKVLQVHCYNLKHPNVQSYCTNYLGFIKSYDGENGSMQSVYQGAGSNGYNAFSLQYGNIALDAENGTMTLTSRGGSYGFKKDRTYRIITIYAETES